VRPARGERPREPRPSHSGQPAAEIGRRGAVADARRQRFRLSGRPRFDGALADGRRAQRVAVAVTLGGDALVLEGGGEAPRTWPYAAITLLEDEGRRSPVRLAHGDERLVIEDPGFRAALALAAPRFRPRGALRTLALVFGLAIASSALGAALWWGTPLVVELAAAALPSAVETRLGEAVLRGIPGRRCDQPAGRAALERLTQRLLGDRRTPFPIRVGVVELGHVNAFAAPGGYIMLFDGLLQRAQSADEVAGVLAHELSHALKRHPSRHLVRTLGTSVLLDLLLGGGGTMRQAGEAVLALSYSRDLEREADDGALALLAGAGIGSAGFAAFLERVPASEGPAWLRTHPTTDERRALAAAASPQAGTPSLAPQEWQALKAICQQG
jgi:Zn-dependent protease with chaperone function